MKIWNDDNPKATMMLEKRNAIIEAAGKVFLESGYAESSMNRVADKAGVSIKTVYRHFENKDDLFVAVIKVACITFSEEDQDLNQEPSWFKDPPTKALTTSAKAYMKHILDKDHIALFRVINRDSHKFPELGQKYHQEVVQPRNLRLVSYLNKWKKDARWKLADPELAANTFAALLRGQIFENILLGLNPPNETEFNNHLNKSVEMILQLLESGKI